MSGDELKIVTSISKKLKKLLQKIIRRCNRNPPRVLGFISEVECLVATIPNLSSVILSTDLCRPLRSALTTGELTETGAGSFLASVKLYSNVINKLFIVIRKGQNSN
jgi:hypothetical protein